jgi:hypothetical protein
VPRITPEFGGIQANFCKKPDCENYAIPAAQITGRRIVAPGTRRRDDEPSQSIT